MMHRLRPLRHIYPELEYRDCHSREIIMLHRITQRTYGGEKGRKSKVLAFQGHPNYQNTRNHNFNRNMSGMDTTSLIWLVEKVLRLNIDQTILDEKNRVEIERVITTFLARPSHDNVQDSSENNDNTERIVAQESLDSMYEDRLSLNDSLTVWGAMVHEFIAYAMWPELLLLIQKIKDKPDYFLALFAKSGIKCRINNSQKVQPNALIHALKMHAPVEVIEAICETFPSDERCGSQIFDAMDERTSPEIATALKKDVDPAEIGKQKHGQSMNLGNRAPAETLYEYFKDLSPTDLMNGPIYYAFTKRFSEEMSDKFLELVDFESRDENNYNIVMIGLKVNQGWQVGRALKKLINRMPENYIDEVEKNGQTVTMIASKECFSFVTEVMEQITADHINLVDESGWTLLHHILSNKRSYPTHIRQQKENICTLLSRISVEEKMVQSLNGLTLLMSAARQGWDGQIMTAILKDTPPEYKNIQTKNSLKTAAMMFIEAKRKEKFPLDIFNLLVSGVEATQVSLKDKDGCNLGYHACSFCVALLPASSDTQYYGYNYYLDTNHIEISRSHANFLCELFELMPVEERMLELNETLLVMLLARLPVNMTPEFEKALKLLMKDTSVEWRMKGSSKTTPLMLACKHDCLLDDEIFDLLTKDMPQSYFEQLISVSKRGDYGVIKNVHSTALRTLIKSSCKDKTKIIIKLVSLLSIDHIYKVFEFGTYLMDFALNFNNFAGIQEFVKACPVDKMNGWLLATNEVGENILHVIAKLKCKKGCTTLNELLSLIPPVAMRTQNKKKRTPVKEFLRLPRRANGLSSKMFLQLNDGQRIVSADDNACFMEQRTRLFMKKCLPILVKQQMCYSLWIMDQVIYSDVIKRNNETTDASTINLTDEDMLDILPWTNVLFKYGHIVDDILLEDDDEKDDSENSDFDSVLVDDDVFLVDESRLFRRFFRSRY
eukprot:TRINITY_DN1771_c0_g1_i1.p1 TRINITY_DN1771_c0_g1~~TRINITY_DN1771_c0_g1_i1.p1  ORF type:complete len:948 (-),score=160.91 TRINITY_DN1771_c0_g1_i1:78-2921(-)